MDGDIKTTKIGKLRIYLKIGEKVQGDTLVQKFFSKNKYVKMLDEAKNSGIRNAHIYQTIGAYENGGKIQHYNLEVSNSGLTVCLELVDEKEKLQSFFKTHRRMFKNRTVIFTEVEFWEHSDD